MSDPYTDSEAAEARQWVNRHGPANAWTGTAGTAARMIGRLLGERSRLIEAVEAYGAAIESAGMLFRNTDSGPNLVQPRLANAEREAVEWVLDRLRGTLRGNTECDKADTLRGLLERLT